MTNGIKTEQPKNNLLHTIIGKNGSFILTQGTLNMTDLLAEAYDVLNLLDVNQSLRESILGVYVIEDKDFKPEDSLTVLTRYNLAHVHEQKYNDATTLWHEDVYDFFNEISPEGYNFGSSEGDSSFIGWFKESNF